MGLFNWFSSKAVDDFAHELVQEICDRYPPEMETAEKQFRSEKVITNILESIAERAAELTKENKLGFYKKARLGNTFKWAMSEAGYSKEFIALATEGLIVYITRK